jgi:hypothetical protein
LAGTVELFERNTALSGFVGYGRDQIDPTSFADDDAGRWPASHQRVTGGASLLQLVSAAVNVSGGAALSYQWGRLSSPYRRALVHMGVGALAGYKPVAERHPDTRARLTSFVASSLALGGGLALHLRLTGYADSWDVRALAPEVALAVELGSRWLGSLGYRLYLQGPASFYQERYLTLDELHTGDRRLGSLVEHLPSVDLAWTPVGTPGRAGAWVLRASYQLSILTFEDVSVAPRDVAHIGALGATVLY